MAYKYPYDIDEKKYEPPKLKTNRSMWKLIILQILTLGIYGIVFFIPFSFDLDKIFLEFITDSALASSVIADSRDQLCHDLLAEITSVDAPDYTGNIDLEAVKITVKVKKQ